MKVLITGANGFIGKNLQLHLRERKDVEVVHFLREHSPAQLADMLRGVDVVFHLAGVNRPEDPAEFTTGNADLTHALCEAVTAVAQAERRKISMLHTSSIHATADSPYGRSKRAAEEALMQAGQHPLVSAHVFRLPNVFGKWSRPHYNSAVATFCHNIARDLPIDVHNAQAALSLVYVDDVLDRFLQLMDGADPMIGPDGFSTVHPQYTTTVGELAQWVRAFHQSRETLVTERVGTGLVRALYATYVSYLPVESFAYAVPRHEDRRGMFVEMLKTPDAGQFSFFTAHAGITRGGHYHHSKTEKFLVIKGQALFRFRHMQTGQTHELVTTGHEPQVVETVPGWTHDITNTGLDEMVVMLWANEIFDRARPDTYNCPI
ncbi:NAD-dependent epimerase/dehydratase family protein [Hydrogenophaga sp.]|uniref:UDP-2-acetamido-2,6-beta-L-arabino-hexul-4-ose reductase n=1 Tax=Hydrogenophaga sp. TaxID=1904254 RepID=UPI00271DE412|nr:NAD-dependent epimerase/dehydratase family protein [Hydrogenophaga sp.]MDO9438434.1 NAD-dependent epimerase/dehydratase family protein [Hydrogenophaga sp.]